jgi:hypothetical protein
MQLLFSRTKIFMLHDTDKGELRYVGVIGTDGRAPAWIAQTETFKAGIRDGSIIDLRAKAAAEEAEVETATEAGEAAVEASQAQPQPRIPAGNIIASTQPQQQQPRRK